METINKNALLEKAKQHVNITREKITGKLEEIKQIFLKGKKEFARSSGQDQLVQSRINQHNEQRLEELKNLYPSPYFVRCDVVYNEEDGTEENKELYFAKFSFSEESIYSWTTHAASIRFEQPGEFSYMRPDGTLQRGKLIRKDQYMIVDGKIIFLATEAQDQPRQLIHQEHFSSRKQGFVLPEIVAQMEKAQDQVVRAHHVGPFVICGPAGSGKTTLALHRVAYLVQSPDTNHLYPAKSIIVFVQDNGTKDYFSHLLPELGINDVKITTFFDWATNILEIKDAKWLRQFGQTEQEAYDYEQKKLQALRNFNNIKYNQTDNVFDLLKNIYQNENSDFAELFQKQIEQKLLDRFDLTLLLKNYIKIHGQLSVEEEYYVELKNGTLKKKVGQMPLNYSLMIIDEFQNYLPEQLNLFKNCLDDKKKSIVYVGDMAQQIYSGTLRNWDEIGEIVNQDRSVKLQKVYRNSKKILQYIQKLGYKISIPDEIKKGPEVVEKILAKHEHISYAKEIIEKSKEKSVGILAKDINYLEDFKKEFAEYKNVHILSMSESQGVEFDVVCIFGLDKKMINCINNEEYLNEEKNRINKDLLYVALTRAIEELHVVFL